jgi:hypothetical protein
MEERRCEVMAAYELSLSNDGKEPRACETEGVKRSTIEAAIALTIGEVTIWAGHQLLISSGAAAGWPSPGLRNLLLSLKRR